MRTQHLISALIALALTGCVSSQETTVSVSDATPVARGQALAKRLCADCHAVGRFDHSAHTDAPPFRNLSDLYPVDSIEEALVEGLMTGHPDMPEFQFNDEAASDFIAYLESIQQQGVDQRKQGDR
jgi:mono/diheme cytochrome c family protein